jgi:hypothetical protein
MNAATPFEALTAIAAAMRMPLSELEAPRIRRAGKGRYAGCDQRRCWQRHIAAWLMREVMQFSYPKIGEILGRDHSTIMHSCRLVAHRVAREPAFGSYLRRLRLLVEQHDVDPFDYFRGLA